MPSSDMPQFLHLQLQERQPQAWTQLALTLTYIRLSSLQPCVRSIQVSPRQVCTWGDLSLYILCCAETSKNCLPRNQRLLPLRLQMGE